MTTKTESTRIQKEIREMAMTRLGARGEALLKRLKGLDHTLFFRTEGLTNLEVIQLSDAVWKVTKYAMSSAQVYGDT